jgi:hypothetical protein
MPWVKAPGSSCCRIGIGNLRVWSRRRREWRICTRQPKPTWPIRPRLGCAPRRFLTASARARLPTTLRSAAALRAPTEGARDKLPPPACPPCERGDPPPPRRTGFARRRLRRRQEGEGGVERTIGGRRWPPYMIPPWVLLHWFPNQYPDVINGVLTTKI